MGFQSGLCWSLAESLEVRLLTFHGNPIDLSVVCYIQNFMIVFYSLFICERKSFFLILYAKINTTTDKKKSPIFGLLGTQQIGTIAPC